MYNFNLNFSYPWLLLLLIPAVVFTLLPYFRLSKKYRRTRNRIISIVLHMIIMLFAITLLAGMTFDYEVDNNENEVILLVDVSNTTQNASQSRDDFVKAALDRCVADNIKVGVVTFGFGEITVADPGFDADDIFDKYKASGEPDITATNIASALNTTQKMFSNPKTSKIVLVTDGKETDEKAEDVIGSIVASGTKVDIAYIPSTVADKDMQIISVQYPTYHLTKGAEFNMVVTFQSKQAGAAAITLKDNGTNTSFSWSHDDIEPGTFNVTFPYVFQTSGFHELEFSIAANPDDVDENNIYVSYYNFELFNKVLVLESSCSESTELVEFLEDNDYEVTLVDILSGTEDVPKTVLDFCQYDQVILNNISNQDMTDAMDGEENVYAEILHSYVYDFGGGLFTVGGTDESGTAAHAYDSGDMYNSSYQKLLPVRIEDYTPPIGVVIIIDRSGSMSGADNLGYTKVQQAKKAAQNCLDQALSPRDYVGVLTIDNDFEIIINMTPVAQRDVIWDAIEGIGEATGGTVLNGGVRIAGTMLAALNNVARRHIIVITDGAVPTGQQEVLEDYVEQNYMSHGITFTVVGIGLAEGSSAYNQMLSAVNRGGGKVYTAANSQEVALALNTDLQSPEISGMTYSPFYPTIYNTTSPVVAGVEVSEDDSAKNRMTVQLGGFYGSRVRDEDYLILTGDYSVPIYAQWKVGKGMVGSFMCDLSGGEWSIDFLSDANGQTLLNNIITNLMPTERIISSDISVVLVEDNYTNKLSVYTAVTETQTIVASITKMSGGEEDIPSRVSLNTQVEESVLLAGTDMYVLTPMTASNKFSRCTFIVKSSGVYHLLIEKYALDENGNIPTNATPISSYSTYKAFSYSKEYDSFMMPEEGTWQDVMANLAEKADGHLIVDWSTQIGDISEDFSITLKKSFDPRYLFMILAIIFFLMDIAVRKFKFKWIHEIIRERKAKKAEESRNRIV